MANRVATSRTFLPSTNFISRILNSKTLRGTEGGVDEKGTKYKWTELFEKQ